MNNLQKEVKKYALENGTTVDAMAKAAGMNRATLYVKLSGKTEFKVSEAVKMAEIMGIDLERFCNMALSADCISNG